MRPWTVWWDFSWKNDTIKYIVIRTDHPKYKHTDHICRFPIKDCEDCLGTIDKWEAEWFIPFRDDLVSGRKSLHKIMKKLEQ